MRVLNQPPYCILRSKLLTSERALKGNDNKKNSPLDLKEGSEFA